MFERLKYDEELKFIQLPKNPKDKSKAIVDFKYVVPTRYLNRGLLILSSSVTVLNVASIIVGNKYKNKTNTSMITFTPRRIEKSKDGEYFIFSIGKGDDFACPTVVRSTEVIKPFIDETMIKGNVPKFLRYYDYLDVFMNIAKTTGSNMASDMVIISALVSLLARTEADTDKPWRLADKKKDKLKWIGFNNVGLSRTDGYSQLVGAYMREGLTASSLRENDFVIELEKILKGN